MNLRLAFTAALVALAAGAAPLTAATAAEQPGPHDDCFPTRAITGYGISDERTAYVTVGVRHYFLRITGSARDLDWNHNISVRSISPFVCAGNGVGVQLMGGYPPVPHQVVGIERAPPGEPPHWSPSNHSGEHTN